MGDRKTCSSTFLCPLRVERCRRWHLGHLTQDQAVPAWGGPRRPASSTAGHFQHLTLLVRFLQPVPTMYWYKHAGAHACAVHVCVSCACPSSLWKNGLPAHPMPSSRKWNVITEQHDSSTDMLALGTLLSFFTPFNEFLRKHSSP
eukprot:1142493-Pelagomonas_calceolata.AAC.1